MILGQVAEQTIKRAIGDDALMLKIDTGREGGRDWEELGGTGREGGIKRKFWHLGFGRIGLSRAPRSSPTGARIFWSLALLNIPSGPAPSTPSLEPPCPDNARPPQPSPLCCSCPPRKPARPCCLHLTEMAEKPPAQLSSDGTLQPGILMPRSDTIRSVVAHAVGFADMPRTNTNHDNGIAIQFRELSLHVTQTKETKKAKDAAPIKEITVHLLRSEDVFTSTHPSLGLENAAVERKMKEGKNAISPPPKNYLRQIITYVFGGFNALLWLSCILSVISYEPLGAPDPQAFNIGVAGLLLIVILVSSGFYALVDFQASKIMSSIQGLVAQSATVTRNGVKQDVPAADIVVGDLVHLSLGQRVPADLRLVEVSSDLKFDRALLTGEADPISGAVNPTDKNALETRNLALSSTFVVQGTGVGVCFAIGDNTIMGRIVGLSGKQKFKQTTIQREISYFTNIITAAAITAFVATLIAWGAWLKHSYPNYANASQAIINSIGCLTAFVPQGRLADLRRAESEYHCQTHGQAQRSC
ncbi:E1-E2 ATPase-domain-containing protein [Blyttiomyces helicus]|uniref:E1-E2 ATPase-domain-containing protein n=1 Tax=Blyttiomyces helicus TaxID=388810 RepID=A0A4P9W910_9FUNG|nr:E1-E2 ATPase-domain-containing protein [Blyttiomyces helicus]|eukprot:RKO89029.1 E1-E2 ATPase-domain-containing protein [Blyttiomyces helicus]